MAVAMMPIREVNVVMGQRFMVMPVTVLRSGCLRLVVLVLVVLIAFLVSSSSLSHETDYRIAYHY